VGKTHAAVPGAVLRVTPAFSSPLLAFRTTMCGKYVVLPRLRDESTKSALRCKNIFFR